MVNDPKGVRPKPCLLGNDAQHLPKRNTENSSARNR